MAEVKCPMCSKPNPEELDTCQFCEARLKPLTDELSRSQPPIQPGDEPTPLDTGELEPVLPQWLREVRKQARDSAEEQPEQFPAEEDAAQPEEKPDLLAGLQSQAEDNEEIPDWLASLNAEGGQAESDEALSEDGLDSLKIMLGEETPAAQESDAGSLPGWVSDLGAGEAETQAEGDELSAFLADTEKETPPQTESQPAASGSDLEWAADFGAASAPQTDSAEDDTPIDTSLPGWLQGADEKPEGEAEIDLPAGMGVDEPVQAAAAVESEETLQSAAEGDMPDWLSSLGGESADPAPQQEPAQPTAPESESPDGLAALGGESADPVPQQEPAQPTAPEGETPDWLASPGEESRAAQSGEPAPTAAFTDDESLPALEGETPDWLAALGGESADAAPQQEPAPTAATADGESQPALEGESPDWLAALGGENADNASQGEPAQPAFIDDEGTPLSTDDIDAIFSMDMPDWLSSEGGQAEGTALATADGIQADNLSPAELPSWVQAMRPVEFVISGTEGKGVENQPLEESGPLAGLRGVLPAVSGVGPSSTPKAYSIKLQASEDQQSSAVMLEQMLAEEIHPKPIVTQKTIRSQRILRWLITGVLLLVVGGTVYTGTKINPMPTGASPEIKAFLEDYVQNTLPANAPVLLIFDYEAALAGEMEAAAAPLIDSIILQKAPRLSIISSTPMGAGLAERFMSLENTQASIYYQAGQQYVNLGYLPGGAAGVLAFAESPADTKPLSTTGENAWETPVLQGVSGLSNFAAIILITSDVQSARIWIEQTESARGETRFLVVSSAQSGPMILPYVQSGQVDGMVTGLKGSAPIEQANSGRPGMVRRYWDAYGFGLLTAITMISFGSLWSLVTGWQERRKEQGKG